MLDPRTVATNVQPVGGGLWTAGTTEPISYPEHGNESCFRIEDESFWFRHRSNCIKSIMRLRPPRTPLFDIGGGNGFVAAELQREGIETVLIEPGPAGARHAITRGVRTVICTTLHGAGLRPHVIPAAGLFDVLEHIEDDYGFLRTLRSHMVPGGRLYVTVPAYGALWSDEDDAAGHYRRYTLRELYRVLARAGFVTEYGTYLFGLLPLPILLARTLPSRLGVARAPSDDTARREHAATGRIGSLVDWCLQLEHRYLAAGHRIPFGGSCLVVARAAAAGD